MSLTDEQARAVELALTASAPIVALTGFPGCGKTHSVRVLLERAQTEGRTVELAAPTGKAAQRLQELTGRGARTLHSLLGLRPGAYAPDPDRMPAPLDVDVLVVDEASMVDAQLAGALVKARRRGRVGTILLVGDAEQLPPVGPGCPFLDLLAAGKVLGDRLPTVRLEQIHRQAEGSGVIQAAHAIRQGKPPTYNETDFRLVRCDEAADVPARIWELCLAEGLDPRTSQILVPQEPGPAGYEAINRYVEKHRRAVLEDPGPEVLGLSRGSKVVNTKNDYERGTLNGDQGYVVEVEAGDRPERNRVRVEFDSGVEATYTGGGIKRLLSAWAMTVHRSQGSEWADVVVVAHRTHTHMLTRSLLYVAATRASSRVFVVGTPSAVSRGVRKVDDATRRTMLSRWARAEAKAVAS